MAKQTLSVKPDLVESIIAPRTDGRTEFHLRPGVAWVNGKRVRGASTIFMNNEEAAYDLSLDRVAPADQPVPARWLPDADAADASGAADGRD